MVLCDTEVPSGEKGVEEEVSHVKLNYGIVSVTMSSDSRHSSSQQSRTHCEKSIQDMRQGVVGFGLLMVSGLVVVWLLV